MRKLIIFSMLVVGLIPNALAQRAATSTITNFNNVGSVYSFEIWARRTSTPQSILVGTSQFFLFYNSSALGSPALSNINSKYTGLSDHSGDYDPMNVAIVAGRIVVTILFTGNDAGVGLALSTASPDGEMICTVSLPVVIPSQSSGLSWDEINSAITTSNSQPVANSFAGSDDTPLPVQLANFTVSAPKQNQVRLDWTTLTETNNYGFEVQKSGDGKNYQTISNSFIPGHGTTIQPHAYSYTDAEVGSEQNYYRLKQIDLDGSVHFSEGQQLNALTSVKENPLPTEFALDQNYPNPFNPSTMIEFALPKETRVTLEVYNILGQRVSTLVDESRPAGYYNVSFDAKGLASGLYFYRMQTGELSFLKKMVVMK